MAQANKNNFISIGKALGIILMVLGHSGCSGTSTKMIYFFHMPLFFLCSGYFFSNINSPNDFKNYLKRKIKSLYIPFLKYSLVFILLHNCFIKLHIYSPQVPYYDYKCIYIELIKAITMTDFELLIRPFWFIKELLLGSVLIASLSFILKSHFEKRHQYIVFSVLLFLAIFCRQFSIFLPIIGDISILFLCASYIVLGTIYKKIEQYLSYNIIFIPITIIILWLGANSSINHVDLRYIRAEEIPIYYILSIIGIHSIFSISKIIMKFSIRHYFFYLGTHTMPIFALNLLALKVGNLLKIFYFGLPIEQLANHPVIFANNKYFFLIYTSCGIIIPLCLEYMYNKIKELVYIPYSHNKLS